MAAAEQPQRLENHFTVGQPAETESGHRGTIIAVINEPVDGVQRVEIETEDGVINTDKSRVEVL